jgi:predicted nucleic acid-binding Zn ribbon protein
VSLPAAPFPQARRPHDPTGLDLAARIAQAARGGRPAPRRRRPGPETADETAWSGPGPSERDPRPVGQLLDRVIADQGWRRDLSVASLLGHWADFVGPANAAHTKPESFRNGELSVRAESTAWATAIRLLAPQIAARLNAALGGGVVERVKVLGPEMPNRPKGRRSVRGRGPRGDYG